MTFTARIRMILIAVALFPPALMMLVVYTYSSSQEETRYLETASAELARLNDYTDQFRGEVATALAHTARHDWFERSVRLLQRGRAAQISFDDLRGFGFDFSEILDSSGVVVASYHRPGLIGERIAFIAGGGPADSVRTGETVEYDIEGRHAAFTGIARGIDGYALYAGRYIDRAYLPFAEKLIHGHLRAEFKEDLPPGSSTGSTTSGSMLEAGDTLFAVVAAADQSAFQIIADFTRPDQSAAMASFTNAISLVALASVLAAVGLGIYISLRARREFDNLVDAFGRVAGGDLNTTVMAYSEGEFSQLADSFSEMTRKLRMSQERLATTEKIAAWQSMARKIAHEVKNPLTPIGISADDLRRSYQEQLPGFEQTLDNNTRLIKSEVNRLTRLLDEFVAFARMKPPELQDVPPSTLAAKLQALYQNEIASARLSIALNTTRPTVRLDPDLITQLLVNLVKNGLEAAENAEVAVSVFDEGEHSVIVAADNGPGFPETVLARQFEPYLSSKKGGSGLGLAICQRIAFDHGGRIELKNRTEGGAEVSVWLPQD